MIIGLLRVDLYLPMVFSLKDKRRIIKSLMEKARNRYNIAISEIDNNDLWKNATLGLVTVSNNKKQVERLLLTVLSYIEKQSELEIIEYKLEFY